MDAIASTVESDQTDVPAACAGVVSTVISVSLTNVLHIKGGGF